jgi:hypothetical protein
MRRSTIIVGLVFLPILLQTVPTYADIDVDPSTRKPTLQLKAVRVKKPHHHKATTVISEGPKKDRSRPVRICKVDPLIPNYGCRTAPSGDGATGRRKLTEGDVLNAVREIGLPSLKVRIQPGSSTLVNVRTIFYTRPQDFRRSVTLLGYDIDLVAQPIQYTWRHGDGTTSTTSRPGKPYPSMDVTYRYRQPAKTVNPRVDVTYRVRYRVDGGNWTTIGQTLLASGPTTTLEVKEAAPVLTAP